MRKYWTAYSIALQETAQRRASLIMDRIGGLAVILSLYYFWKTLLADRESFLGYSAAQMLSYVLLMNVLRSFALSGRGWELVGEISAGRISSYLVRPLSYAGYSLSLDLAQKTLHLLAAFVEVGALILLVQAPFYLPARPETWLMFSAALIVSSLLFFLLEFLVASLAFWTSESGGPLFCFELFLQFASGAFFPLDVLPAALQNALYWTPFPFMVFLPINIYLEKMPLAEAAEVLAGQGLWLLAVMGLVSWVWKAGLRDYAAEGG